MTTTAVFCVHPTVGLCLPYFVTAIVVFAIFPFMAEVFIIGEIYSAHCNEEGGLACKWNLKLGKFQAATLSEKKKN